VTEADASGDAGRVRRPAAPTTYRTCDGDERDSAGGFCDVTARWGIDVPVEIIRGRMRSVRGGVTVADFDGDGHVDVFVGMATNLSPQLLMHRGDRWVDEAAARGLGALRGVLPSAAADLDGDGDQDLVVAFLSRAPVRVFRNDGGRFEEAAAPLGEALETGAVLPADLDRDGRLDLLVAGLSVGGVCEWGLVSGCPAGLRAYRQVAPWRFEPVRVDAPPRRAQAITVADGDGDGRDDVLVATDFGMFDGGNLLLHVDLVAGGGFALSDATAGSGFDQQVFGMGVQPIDVGGDDVDELFVTSFARNVLLARRGGRLVDVAVELGADTYGILIPGERPVFRPLDRSDRIEGPLAAFADQYMDTTSPLIPTTKWAPVVFDADDDGLSDLYITAGAMGLSDLFPEATAQQSSLLRGTRDGLVDVTEAMRAGTRRDTSGAIAADLDEDGDLDLALFHMATEGGPGGLAVLRNDMSAGRSLTVVARGLGGGRDGIGARVEVRTRARAAHRRIDGNVSIFGSGPHEAHFGLGSETSAQTVTVRFPSGAVVTRSDVPAGRVVIEEPAAL
jgi:hypothetical protein